MTLEQISDALFDAATRHDEDGMEKLFAQLVGHDEREARALEARSRGLLANNRADYKTAMSYYEEALQLYTDLGNTGRVASCTMDIALVYAKWGQPDRSLSMLHSVRDMFEAMNDRDGVVRARLNIAIRHDEAGRLHEALEQYRACYAEVDPEDVHLLASVLHNIAAVLSDLGQHAESLEASHRALELYERGSEVLGIVNVLALIGDLFATNAEYATAIEYLDRALDACMRGSDRRLQSNVLLSKARVLNALGDKVESERLLRQALDIMGDDGSDYVRWSIRRALGIDLRSLGRYDEAREIFSSIVTASRDVGYADRVNDALCQLALTMIEDGQTQQAREIFDSREGEATQNIWGRTVVPMTEARLLVAEGRYDEAQRAALELLSIVQAHAMADVELVALELLMKIARHRNEFDAYVQYSAEATACREKYLGGNTHAKIALLTKEREIREEREQRTRERALLYGTLPPAVAERLVRGESVTGDHFDNAAVMFLDIVGFTTHTSHMPPAEVVKLLESIFRTIDGICAAHNVIKIKTIGDSYMCFRGDANASTNAVSVANVALDVLQVTFTWPDGSPVQCRIGAHIGPVTAGVIGTERLQYDVWGDTVNVASRMESSSQPGHIHVSQAFAQALDPGFRRGDTVDGHPGEGRDPYHAMVADAMKLRERGEIEIKGKGLMTTYWLEGA